MLCPDMSVKVDFLFKLQCCNFCKLLLLVCDTSDTKDRLFLAIVGVGAMSVPGISAQPAISSYRTSCMETGGEMSVNNPG